MAYVIALLQNKREEIMWLLANKEPELVEELRQVDMRLYGICRYPDFIIGPYNGMRRPLDAITLHLSSLGHPDTRENIVNALVAGGISLGERTKLNIMDSIRYHSSRSKKLTVVPACADNPEERIGLPE